MRTHLVSTAAVLLFTLVAAASVSSQSASGGLIIRFAPGALEPPSGTSAGPVEAFSFQDPSLRSSLISEGVTYLAKLFPSFKPEDRFSVNLIGEPVLLDDLSGFYIASLNSPATAEARLRAAPGVLDVGRPQTRSLLSACPPDSVDTYFNKQWWLHNTGDSLLCTPNPPSNPWPRLVADADINAPEAWCITTGDSSVRVAIIDTGIWASHQDLNVSLAEGFSFFPVQPIPPPPACYTSCPAPVGCAVTCDSTIDVVPCGYLTPDAPEDDHSHGTAVAGIVAAIGNNGKGVAGVAWKAKAVPIKITDCEGSFSSCFSARAIDSCRVRKIPILNMSYGGSSADIAERAAARNAFYAGQLLVAGIGNGDAPGAIFPAGYAKTVCTVGAFFGNGRRWDESPPLENRGSNYHPAIDLAAPGGNLIATTHWGCRLSTGAYYDLAGCGALGGNDFGGTSAATPVVSGVAALILGKYKAKGVTGADEPLLGEDLYQAMIITARHPDVDSFGAEKAFDDSAGFGHVRADTALKLLAPPRVVYHRLEGFLSVFATDTVQRVLKNFNIPGLSNDSSYTIRRFVLRKTVVFPVPFLETPIAWARSSGTMGLRDTLVYDKEQEVREGRIVSVSPTGYTVETTVYNIIGAPPPYEWYPGPPARTVVATTLVGVPTGGVGASAGEALPVNSNHDRGVRLPTSFALRQNEPNPFGSGTTIRFDLPVGAKVRLEVFDAQGRLVRILADERFAAGFHAVEWDRRDGNGHPLRAGVYLYRVRAGSFHSQRKMVLLGH